MAIEVLKALQVKQARDGEFSDGGGLLLRVKRDAASFVFRFTAPSGRRREMGLGSVRRSSLAAAGASLTAARLDAQRQRAVLLQGIDPIELRRENAARAKAAAHAKLAESKRETMTLARATRAYHERIIEPTRSGKHAAQWISSLERHVPEELWHRPISEIDPPSLLDALSKLQNLIPETASRIRQRLETVFDDAEFRNQCQGNPARAIRRKLREVKSARRRRHFTALPYSEAPAFIAKLRSYPGIAALALEFTVLTASRTNESIGAKWHEFDLASGVWTLPAARMKAGEIHIVQLAPRCLEILKSLQHLQQPFVFPRPTLDGRPLSNMAMLSLLRRMGAQKKTTVHGLARASFSTWANENEVANPKIVEACLAHREADLVAASYNRAQFARQRASLLRAWADYLNGGSPNANVVELKAMRSAA